VSKHRLTVANKFQNYLNSVTTLAAEPMVGTVLLIR